MDKLNISYEPMDIDLSAHSNNEMDISFNESINENNDLRNTNDDIKPSVIDAPESSRPCSTVPTVSNIKKFHINVQREAVSSNDTTKVKIIFAALVIFLSVVAYHVLNIQCSEDIDTKKLRISLYHKLFGQTEAIDALVAGLELNERSKIIILYGSTGVGKTFATSILLEHVGLCSNIYHYTMPSFMKTFTTDFMVGLTVCKNSLIIVDDLSPDDYEVKVHIKDLLTKTDNLDKAVTVILIYNCDSTKGFKAACDISFQSKVMENFQDIKGYKQIIKFEMLNEEHLRKCIENELRKGKICDEVFKKILKNFNVSADGCKGVHTKMKLLDISEIR